PFLNHITAKHKTLREVGSAEQSSVILAFCPIVSRLGTDIEEALRHLKYEKPVVLVVMHHTSDPEYVVPKSSIHVKDKNIFTVDCLFFDDKGMLNCRRNDDAYDKVVQRLKEHQSSFHSQMYRKHYNQPQPQVTLLTCMREENEECSTDWILCLWVCLHCGVACF
uniref:Uncharacterized protein n=1 Tax=Denticeps clupeoides TaxID=299321 RepID=A0AAY4CHZ4_9TELE